MQEQEMSSESSFDSATMADGLLHGRRILPTTAAKNLADSPSKDGGSSAIKLVPSAAALAYNK